MDAPAPENSRAPRDWLSGLPPVYAGGGGEVARHHDFLLHRCFDGADMRWSDALVARTRRQMGGCIAAVETALRLELGSMAPDLVLPSAAIAWAKVQHRPALLPPALITCLRDRAAIGLMAQDHALGDGPAAESAYNLAHFPASASPYLAALAQGQAAWADTGPDDAPVRADLPAEAYADLIWTVAALLAEALVAGGRHPGLFHALDRASAAWLARHDEQSMPFAQAALLAHQLRGAGVGDDHLLTLSRQRQLLALFAIAADRLGAELPCLVAYAVEADEQALFALCRAVEFPREVAVRLVLGRRCVARGVDDSVLVTYSDGYDGMPLSGAREAVATLGLARPLRVALARLRDHAV